MNTTLRKFLLLEKELENDLNIKTNNNSNPIKTEQAKCIKKILKKIG